MTNEKSAWVDQLNSGFPPKTYPIDMDGEKFVENVYGLQTYLALQHMQFQVFYALLSKA